MKKAIYYIMNLLQKKELLDSLLIQGDIIHTLGGGKVEPEIRIIKKEGVTFLHIRFPSINPYQLDVELNMNRLLITAPLSEHFIHNSLVSLPLTSLVFPFTRAIETEEIKAEVKGDYLKVTLPHAENNEQLNRKIDLS